MMLIGLLLATTSPDYPFSFSTVTDPFDDSVRGIASVTFPEGAIAVKCDRPGPNSIYVHIASNEYLGGAGRGADYRTLVYRAGSAPTKTITATYDDSFALIEGSDALDFMTAMVENRKISLRALRYDGKLVEMTVPYRNFLSPMVRMGKICQPKDFSTFIDVPDGFERGDAGKAETNK